MGESKVDFKKTLPSYAAKHRKFEFVTIPKMRYLMVDGTGDPNTSPAFAQAIEQLYPIAYALKFFSKDVLDRDYVVPPLEALWRAENMDAFVRREKSKWSWTLLLMVPYWLTDEHFAKALHKVESKTGKQTTANVRFTSLDEGLCVQTLHIGSFDDEGPVLKEIHERTIPDAGFTMTGEHHEIYLSDFRKVAPDKLRTILRQPVKKL